MAAHKQIDNSEIARLRAEGASGGTIARALNISPATAFTRLRALGLIVEGRRIGLVPWKKVTPIDELEVVRAHVDRGESVLSIARRMGIQRSRVVRALRDNGVRQRGRSAATLVRMAHEGPEGRERLTQAAHNAVRGVKQSDDEKRKKALARQHIGRTSPIERVFADALATAGFVFTPQLAFNAWNIDFALVEQRTAIEIDPGCWHRTPIKLRIDGEKDTALRAAGWTILRWSGNQISTKNPVLPLVAQQLVAELKGAGIDPSTPLDENWVVWCESKGPIANTEADKFTVKRRTAQRPDSTR